MALLTVASVPATGNTPNLSAVNASDTISGSDVGDRGVILHVTNGGGGSINVTVSDPGTTPAGNVAAGTPAGTVVAVANGTGKRIYVGPRNVNPATGVATITYSGTTSVTAEAYRY